MFMSYMKLPRLCYVVARLSLKVLILIAYVETIQNFLNIMN